MRSSLATNPKTPIHQLANHKAQTLNPKAFGRWFAHIETSRLQIPGPCITANPRLLEAAEKAMVVVYTKEGKEEEWFWWLVTCG